MKTDNINMFHDTLSILTKGAYIANGNYVRLKLSPKEMEEIFVFFPEDIQRISNHHFHQVRTREKIGVGCENMDSYSLAIKRYSDCSHLFHKNSKPILVLNLANPVTPGGGVRRGAKAQEEDLCRKSSLLRSLESQTASSYYAYNKSLNSYMGSDSIMITPQVEIIKDINGDLLENSVVVSVMTCAAPMIRHGLEGLSNQDYQNLMYNRIIGMLTIAAHLEYEVLILGAFGCGAFSNDAHIVSDLFYKALKNFNYNGMNAESFFRRIDFAILSNSTNDYNFREFARNFKDYYREGTANTTLYPGKTLPQTNKNPNHIMPYTLFWLANKKFGEFSNWYRREFLIDDFRYFCVEQYMMAQKAKLFHDSIRYTAILRANTPKECKELGKQVTPFDAKYWDTIKYDIVKTGNRAKFSQNPDLLNLLLSTGNSILAEASPLDNIWGIGMDAESASTVEPSQWPGQNLLGKVLMDLRHEFRNK